MIQEGISDDRTGFVGRRGYLPTATPKLSLKPVYGWHVQRASRKREGRGKEPVILESGTSAIWMPAILNSSCRITYGFQ